MTARSKNRRFQGVHDESGFLRPAPAAGPPHGGGNTGPEGEAVAGPQRREERIDDGQSAALAPPALHDEAVEVGLRPRRSGGRRMAGGPATAGGALAGRQRHQGRPLGDRRGGGGYRVSRDPPPPPGLVKFSLMNL